VNLQTWPDSRPCSAALGQEQPFTNAGYRAVCFTLTRHSSVVEEGCAIKQGDAKDLPGCCGDGETHVRTLRGP
jgi:hypothetical protein